MPTFLVKRESCRKAHEIQLTLSSQAHNIQRLQLHTSFHPALQEEFQALNWPYPAENLWEEQWESTTYSLVSIH